MRAILTAAWTAVLFVASLPASAAQPEWNTPSVRVDYSDPNLNAPHGVSTLQHRVSGAIRQVCDEPAFDLREKLQQQACRRSAGTVASRAINDAIIAAKQLPSNNVVGTSPAGVVDDTSSSSGWQPWNRRNRIPPR